MEQSILDKLYADFNIKTKPGKGQYKYVETKDIFDRMNRVFMGNWSSIVRKTERIGDEILCEVVVNLNNDQGDVLSSHTGFGSAKVFQGVELGNLYKSAKSKAIKDAVRNWGVGLFLEEEEGVHETSYLKSVPSFSNDVKQAPVDSPPAAATQAPIATPTQVVEKSVQPTVAPVQAVFPPATFEKGAATEQPAKTNDVPVFSAPNTTAPVNKVEPKANGGLPPMGAIPPTREAVRAEVSSSTPADPNVQVYITPVQEIVLNAKMSQKKQTFEQFGKELFIDMGKDPNTVPAKMSELPYPTAMEIVAFINKQR